MNNPPMAMQAEMKKRIQLMLLVTCFYVPVFLLCGLRLAVLGLLLGTAVSIFNYWLVAKDPWEKTFNPLLKRYLARMILDGILVIGTGLIHVQLVLGAVAGLTLEMQTYLLAAFPVIFRR